MDTANAKRITWFICLQRILRFQKQHFAPRHAALRLQRPTKDNLSAGISESVALAKLAAFSAGRSGILALGYEHPALVNGRGILAAHMRVPATKTNVLGNDQIRDGPLAALRLIKGQGTEHQVLRGRYQPHPVRGVQIPTRVGNQADRLLGRTLATKHPKFLMPPPSTSELANRPTATPRHFTVGRSVPSRR
jgi:hypothetical protein